MTFTPKKTFPNLRNEEKKALKELRNNKDVTIKPTDKGGALVVLNTTDYVSECTRQLSDTSYYERLDSDPTYKFNKIISDTLTKGKQDREIDSDVASALLVPHPKPGRFYVLPKIHKEGNPGRPIISGNGCPTEIISKFVDWHIQGLVKQLPSYVQDDMDFLRKIQYINDTGPLPPDTLLCTITSTMDVSALYTNIPHGEGIEACRDALEREERTRHPQPHSYASLLSTYSPSTIFNLKTICGYRNTGRPWGRAWLPVMPTSSWGPSRKKCWKPHQRNPSSG